MRFSKEKNLRSYCARTEQCCVAGLPLCAHQVMLHALLRRCCLRRKWIPSDPDSKWFALLMLTAVFSSWRKELQVHTILTRLHFLPSYQLQWIREHGFGSKPGPSTKWAKEWDWCNDGFLPSALAGKHREGGAAICSCVGTQKAILCRRITAVWVLGLITSGQAIVSIWPWSSCERENAFVTVSLWKDNLPQCQVLHGEEKEERKSESSLWPSRTRQASHIFLLISFY